MTEVQPQQPQRRERQTASKQQDEGARRFCSHRSIPSSPAVTAISSQQRIECGIKRSILKEPRDDLQGDVWNVYWYMDNKEDAAAHIVQPNDRYARWVLQRIWREAQRQRGPRCLGLNDGQRVWTDGLRRRGSRPEGASQVLDLRQVQRVEVAQILGGSEPCGGRQHHEHVASSHEWLHEAAARVSLIAIGLGWLSISATLRAAQSLDRAGTLLR